MAQNKKPRKKYHKRRSVFSGIAPSYMIAVNATSKEPIPQDMINDVTSGYRTFLETIKAGTCNKHIFWGAVENHYLYTHLLAALKRSDIKADPLTELTAKLEFDVALNTATHKTAETLDTIGKRYQQRGRWIASGDELKHLEASYQKFREMLGIASQAHYIAAYAASEPILDAEAHRNRKRTGK